MVFMMSRYDQIVDTLTTELAPYLLVVVDESDQHNVPTNAETHFKVTIISDSFSNQSMVSRHRTVNQILHDQFDKGLHALALHTFTQAEWENNGHRTDESPACLGGARHN